MIDSHCHLDFEPLDANEALLSRCAQAGLTDIVVPGVLPSQWSRVREISTRSRTVRIHASAGLHPCWIGRNVLSAKIFAQTLADNLDGCVAIGECGLDGSIPTEMATQEAWLGIHLQMACELGKPLILHGHKAHNELLRLLTRYRPAAGGVIHAFAGSLELARQYWRLGFYIGVGGTITYDRARKTRSAIGAMPLESLVLETDAPDMPLCGAQGQPNSPLQLPKVADCLAVLKAVSLASIVEQTDANAQRLFKLSGC